MTALLIAAVSFLQTVPVPPQADVTTLGDKIQQLQAEKPATQTPLSKIDVRRFRDRNDVRSAVQKEMQSPRYKRLRTRIKRLELNFKRRVSSQQPATPGWWSRFWTWATSWTRTTKPRPAAPPTGGGSTGGMSFGFGAGGLLWPVVWVLLAIALIILIALVIKAASVKRSGSGVKKVRVDSDSDAIAPSTPPGELPSDEYMHRAMELAKDGDHRRAIRQLVLGGMSWIERAGLIRFRKGLTNRDYVRAVYRRTEQRKRFAGIVLGFERVYFGRRHATEQQFEECLAEYRDAFGKAADPAKIAQEMQKQSPAGRTPIVRKPPKRPASTSSSSHSLPTDLPGSESADPPDAGDFDFLNQEDDS